VRDINLALANAQDSAHTMSERPHHLLASVRKGRDLLAVLSLRGRHDARVALHVFHFPFHFFIDNIKQQLDFTCMHLCSRLLFSFMNQ
jgi:hypothetical protein